MEISEKLTPKIVAVVVPFTPLVTRVPFWSRRCGGRGAGGSEHPATAADVSCCRTSLTCTKTVSGDTS
jgi:hypothetical protein